MGILLFQTALEAPLNLLRELSVQWRRFRHCDLEFLGLALPVDMPQKIARGKEGCP